MLLNTFTTDQWKKHRENLASKLKEIHIEHSIKRMVRYDSTSLGLQDYHLSLVFDIEKERLYICNKASKRMIESTSIRRLHEIEMVLVNWLKEMKGIIK
ncbi:hypothetical protein ACSYR0_03675 (plasmid) [Bacillus cereus]|uniref:hypothetical protein n=1 Tax=Bacillus cereus TaxID=1396 RepID=UPI0001A0D1D2|nr:hypothetical protein [Bacillus cereus]EEL61773.1 hypothetical protein bcere0025_55460 [Bacillus cereus F65185]PFI67060.1 hypothetical protein COI85_29580 [Bacillus cereus]PFJ61640.1 hypothetical protein COI94_28370 [Bacillus cereus]PFN38666.1 hypothetical protein COJ57_06590 [Bacillus cereus]